MHKYHFVAKGVAPKREALRIAQEDLAETQRILDEAKNRLREVTIVLLSLRLLLSVQTVVWLNVKNAQVTLL